MEKIAQYGEGLGVGAYGTIPRMKVVILSGGHGTRLQEETTLKPKPMVEIGEYPILLHIMRRYAAYGFKEFIIACGYKGEMIMDYFLNYHYLKNGMTIDLGKGTIKTRDERKEDWIVHLVDTGVTTQTGGRLKRLKNWIGDETFMMPYGDGLADIDLKKLLEFHKNHKRLATVTAVRPTARFGALRFEGDSVVEFSEKNQANEAWINGGYFVLEPKVLDMIDADETIWEREPLERLSSKGELQAYKHEGFWQPMDTLREKKLLETLWESGDAPWKI